VVFKLAPGGELTVLHGFTGLADGGVPEAGVVLDSAGNLYGCTNQGAQGAGVVYRISASGGFAVLYAFTGGADGGNPFGGVVLDPSGNIYGTAANFGQLADGSQGEGVVFELSPAGSYSVLYIFAGGADGSGPQGALTRDSAGNLYGATGFGGPPSCTTWCGVV
jgi:uncharacterized repeat protein (TIGR03803 family)